MLRALLVMLAMMVWAGAARAQWVVDDGAGRHAAKVCTTGVDGFCFEMSCKAGGPLSWRLVSTDNIDLVAAPSVRALVAVGSRMAGELGFVQTEPGVFEAPVEKWHAEGVQQLKDGARAELRLWFDGDAPPAIHALGLKGSRDALTAVEQACAKPAPEVLAAMDKASTNPLIAILNDMKAACDALGGELTVREGLAQAVDLDGRDPIDIRVNHERAECSTSDSLVCGTDGCLASLWLGQDSGEYRQAWEGPVAGLRVIKPGTVEMDLMGRACGGAPCTRRYALAGGQLEPPH